MKNRLSIVVLSSVLLFGMSHSLSAQVVQRGLMLEYNEELAKSPLGGVEVVVRGAPSSVSDASGGFELEFLTQSGGERVSVTRIEKPGYEIFNKEALEQWNINPEEPFRIVMCESGRFKRIRDNYSRVSSESYARQQASEESRLRELLEDGALKEEEYRKELYELKVEYQTKLDDLESYVDRFARIDLSELDEVEREIIKLVQAGDMEGAIAKYEAQDLLGKYRAETEDIREIETARESLDEAEQAKREGRDSLFAAVRRQFETYVLAGGEENYEKAGNLLREVALADTTNLEAVWEYATFAGNQYDYNEAKRFYQILLRAYQSLERSDENIAKEAQINMNIGRQYGYLSDYDLEEQYFLSAIDDFSQLPEDVARRYIARAKGSLAVHYNEISDFDLSEEYFMEAIESQRVISEHGDDEDIMAMVHLYNNYGNLCRSLSRFKDAEQAYSDAIDNIRRLNDNASDDVLEIFSTVKNNMGTLFFRMNRMADAEKAFKTSLDALRPLYKKNPDAFRSLTVNAEVNLALVYESVGEYAKAESYCLEALAETKELFREYPDGYRSLIADVLYNLADIYRKSGKYESAEEYGLKAYENYLILFEDNPGAFQADLADIQNNLGNVYWLMNDYSKAEKYYLSSEDNYRYLYEENPEAYMYRYSITLNNLGVMYANSGQYEKAESYYLRLLDMKKRLFESAPDAYRDGYAMALYNLASLYLNNGRFDEAAEYFEEASENYFKIMSESSGIESYRTNLMNSYYFQGLSYYFSNQYDDAARSFASMCKLDENLGNYGFKTTSILNMLAYSYAFSNDFPSAVQAIDNAIDIEPQNTNLYDSKGEILLMQGDRDGAMKTWEKIMELDPSFAEKHPNSVLYSKLFKETAE